jgi:glyoxylase-like metal-dependent hydrolase (beta-lactamase superfamily II)
MVMATNASRYEHRSEVRREPSGRHEGARFVAGFVIAGLVGACATKAPPVSPASSATTAPAAPTIASSSMIDRPATVAAGDSATTKERSTAQVAAGVYFIRHEDAPDTFPQGNTTLIVGEREALVVDSCYLPSSAKKDIAQIKQWTNKPVRYLVNTHWHYDHTMGNGAYKDAFPGLSIVAQRETRKQIEGYNPQWFTKFPDRANVFKQRIEARKDQDGRALTDGEIAELKTAVAGIEPVWAELREIAARRDMVPTLSFERALDVDLGGREVRLLHLGRGNTAGDTVVYLPREKILIAGDLLDHPVPYLGGGYPRELIATLEAMARLDFEIAVPGHGKVLRGKAHLEQIIDFLKFIVTQVDREVHRTGSGPRNLENVRKAILAMSDIAVWRQRFAGTDRENIDFFDGFALQGVITAAYAEIWPR